MVQALLFRGAKLLGLWVLFAFTGIRWAHGSAIDFTPTGTQPNILVEMLPNDDCAACHAGSSAAERTYMPHSSWAGSMMANATRDPLFWAALDVANHDVPGVGEFCIRCHTPSAWLEGYVHKNSTGRCATVRMAAPCVAITTIKTPSATISAALVAIHATGNVNLAQPGRLRAWKTPICGSTTASIATAISGHAASAATTPTRRRRRHRMARKARSSSSAVAFAAVATM
jgi:hypothetical protein